MNKNTTIGIVVVILVVIGAVIAFANRGGETTPANTNNGQTTDNTNSNNNEEPTSPADTDTDSATPAPSVKSFTVTGGNFSFDVKEIKVNKGDTVRITFKNAEGFHDWVLDEFNAATKKLQANQEETIEFVADKTGTFEYYCSVGTHRAMGMKGNLIVQ